MNSRSDLSVIKRRWSRGDLLELDGCPACGHPAEISNVLARQDDERVMPDRWRMFPCRTCGSIYLNPRPSSSSLARAYETYYTHQAVGAEAAVPDSLRSRAINGYLNRRFRMDLAPASAAAGRLLAGMAPLRMKLDVFGRHVPHHLCHTEARLLDVGCGNGTFLHRANSMGLHAVGTEPDRKAVSAGRQQGLQIIEGDIFAGDLDGTTYDWITMNHVIEHVEGPQSILARAFELLVPGGTLWLGLPNPKSIGAHWLGAGWSGLHPPYHLCIPSQRVLAGWLGEQGFVDVELPMKGLQSADMWRKSAELCRREGSRIRARIVPLLRVGADVLASTCVRWSEETVIMARRPR